MSSGDIVGAHASVADDGYLDVQPSAGIEWIIHNLFVPDSIAGGVEVYSYDGTSAILVGTFTSTQMMVNFHCSNTFYLRMKNVSGSSADLGYDGIVMK